MYMYITYPYSRWAVEYLIIEKDNNIDYEE